MIVGVINELVSRQFLCVVLFDFYFLAVCVLVVL
ncbi:MAG: hypothetical protein K0S94_2552, partial [Nitrospira sp.]|nr:hypothetical protein [Nitrospira sp.]